MQVNKIPYINIHTHLLDKSDNNFIQIKNIYPEDDIPSTLFSVGIHPWNTNRSSVEIWKNLKQKAALPRCLAIGETGLDKQKPYKDFLKQQIISFEKHIDLANRLNKPLIIHCVQCYDIFFSFIEKAETPWIIHGFSKGPELGVQLTGKHQIYLSFGSLLFNPKAKVSGTLQNIPLNKIFLETDDKDLSIKEVYHQASQILNMDEDLLKEQIFKNFQKVFGEV